MPVCSYLMYPKPGQSEKLQVKLSNLPSCTVVPSENHEVFILITDTPNKKEENSLLEKLSQEQDILCMALSFAQWEDENK